VADVIAAVKLAGDNGRCRSGASAGVPQWKPRRPESMRRRSVSRARRSLSLLFAGWLGALALETAPHLVHHLLDEDQGATCEFLAAADEPAVVAAPAVSLVAWPARDLPVDRAVPSRPAVARTAAVARAPPTARLAPG
jgi:hypothetical protein